MRFTTPQRLIIPCVLLGLAFVAFVLLLAQGWLPVSLAMVVLVFSACAIIFAMLKQFVVEDDALVYRTLWKKYRYPYADYSFAVTPLTGLPVYRVDLRGAFLQLEATGQSETFVQMGQRAEQGAEQKTAHDFDQTMLQKMPLALAYEDALEFLDTLQEAVQDAGAGSVKGRWWPE